MDISVEVIEDLLELANGYSDHSRQIGSWVAGRAIYMALYGDDTEWIAREATQQCPEIIEGHPCKGRCGHTDIHSYWAPFQHA